MEDFCLKMVGWISTLVLIACIFILFKRWFIKEWADMTPAERFLYFIVVFSIGWGVFVFLATYKDIFGFQTLEKFGQWGDSFGFVTALFTGGGLYLLLKSLHQHDMAIEKTTTVMKRANELKEAENDIEKFKLCKDFGVTLEINNTEKGDYVFVSIRPKENFEFHKNLNIFSDVEEFPDIKTFTFSEKICANDTTKKQPFTYEVKIDADCTSFKLHIVRKVFNLYHSKVFWVIPNSEYCKYSLIEEKIEKKLPLKFWPNNREPSI